MNEEKLRENALNENVKNLRSEIQQRRQHEEELVKIRRDVEDSLKYKENENRKLKEQLENLEKSGAKCLQQLAEIGRLKAKIQHNEEETDEIKSRLRDELQKERNAHKRTQKLHLKSSSA